MKYDNCAVSWERVVPDKLDPKIRFQNEVLNQHIERYKFASKHAAGKNILDAACGTGYGTDILVRAGAKNVIGVDVDSETIEYAQARYRSTNSHFVSHDLNTWDMDPFVYDMVVSFETVEHLDSPETFLRKIRAKLPPGGVLFASVPTVPTVDIDEFHKHDFSRKSWRKLLNSCGFQIKDELLQRYCASFKDMAEEMKAPNTLAGARKDQLRYYVSHPLQALMRAYRFLRYGLELEILTVRCE